MELQDIRSNLMAQPRPGRYEKSSEKKEGNFDCFSNAHRGYCGRHNYPGRGGCLNTATIRAHDHYQEKIMTHPQMQQLAGELGINELTEYTSQTRLIRSVQILRGGDPCFSTEKRYNCEEDCEWSQNCRKLRAVWLC